MDFSPRFVSYIVFCQVFLFSCPWLSWRFFLPGSSVLMSLVVMMTVCVCVWDTKTWAKIPLSSQALSISYVPRWKVGCGHIGDGHWWSLIIFGFPWHGMAIEVLWFWQFPALKVARIGCIPTPRHLWSLQHVPGREMPRCAKIGILSEDLSEGWWSIGSLGVSYVQYIYIYTHQYIYIYINIYIYTHQYIYIYTSIYTYIYIYTSIYIYICTSIYTYIYIHICIYIYIYVYIYTSIYIYIHQYIYIYTSIYIYIH